MRVHELAKKLNLTSKELLAQLSKQGIKAKNHMELLDSKAADSFLKKFQISKSEPSKKAVGAKTVVKSATASSVAVRSSKLKVREKKELPKKQGSLKPVTVKEIKKEAEEKKSLKTTTLPKQPVKKEEAKSSPSKTIVQQVAEPVQKATAVIALPAPVKTAAIKVEIPVTLNSLAEKLNLRASELIKTLIGIGIFANVNQMLNEEIVMKLSDLLKIHIEKIEDKEVKAYIEEAEEDQTKLKPRPPVVTLMGHVDHGKTSLLDAIRKSNVADKEAGQITQHIGAYGVEIPGKGHVTFLDTPGHQAFTAMRARGANVTDVVVLVVAADDGVMPQTLEAIDHARAAGVPIVVAINKSDLPTADHQKVMGELQKHGLMPEEWGGKTICVKVSAKTGQGIEQLLEMLLLEAEVLELKANPDRPAMGAVVEGRLSKGSGPVATVIVQKGTLRMGDMVVAGPHMGRVRSLRNDRGKNVREAGPSYAAELSGLNGVPEAGENFFVVEDEKVARKITEKKTLELREREMRGAPKHLSLEDLYHRISEGNFRELKIILKADVQGSIEALSQSLEKLSTDKCRLQVIHGGVGGVNESDIMLAAASDAIILGFHVKADPKAQELSGKEGVDMRFYNIIYEAVEDVRKAMEGLLEPTYKEVVEGRVQLRQIFKSSRAGTIGGGMVLKGKIVRQNRVRVVRNNIVLFDGKLTSLRRFKDDVREVAEGYECGLSLEGFQDLHEGDLIESYRLDKTATKL